MAPKSNKLFISSLVLFGGAYVFLKLVFPFVARIIVGAEANLPVPGTLFIWYMTLITIAFFIYLSSSEEDLRGFLHPVLEAIRGRGGASVKVFKVVFYALPFFVGYQIYDAFVPRAVVPAVTRQQHPGMSHAGAAPYADLENPHRAPTPQMLEDFLAAYDELPDQEGVADALPLKVDAAALNAAEQRQLYSAEAIVEGRQLYQKNCRPCHGTGFDGAGPMARAFKLRPVAFNDPGTIATLVENSVFWRVSEGGIGLPAVSTPWDSPMPKWKDELDEDERWKIIMAIYHEIGMKPRVLEMKVE